MRIGATEIKREVKDMTVKEMRTLLGLSQKAFGEKYQIPMRTIQDWEAGKRTPPIYVMLLLERAVLEDAKRTSSTYVLL